MSVAASQPIVPSPAVPRRPAANPAAVERARNWITLFLVVHIGCAIGLYLFGNTSLRMPLRIGLYAASLSLLFLIKGRGHKHPASVFFELIAAVLLVGLLNPDRSSWTAGVAQVTLYLAVIAPIVWVSRLVIDRSVFYRVALILWIFYTLSSIVGALQVRYPGQFDGAMSANYDDKYIGAMTITLADGTMTLRPKGLTDVAGGAGASGVFSVCLGFGLLLTTVNPFARAAIIGTMVLSLFNIYLSHGRTNLVVVAVDTLVLLYVLQRRKSFGKIAFLMMVVCGVSFIGTSLAFTVGGEQTINRWNTLLDDSPGQVAYQNRGIFLEVLLKEDIYKYPLGAGSGRWGMMLSYFGDPSAGLWAEMMWQALLYDGGIPLIIMYLVMLGIILHQSMKIGVNARNEELGVWAGVVSGFTVATMAASFVYPVYIKAAGLEMILLNACLFGYYRFELAKARGSLA